MSFRFAGIAALIVTSPIAAQSFETWRNVPLSPGDWNYVAAATGGEARFGSSFLVRCDRATRLVLLQRRAAPQSTAAAMTIITDSATRSFAGSAIRLGARDALLDAIAFSRGRIVVSGGGGAALILPGWPEAARSIEDCRN